MLYLLLDFSIFATHQKKIQMDKLHVKNNAFFSQLLFILLLIAVGLLIFCNLSYLLTGALGAITFYILLRKMAFNLIEKRRWKSWAASLLLTTLSVLIVVFVFFILIELIIGEVPDLHLSHITEELGVWTDNINQKVGFTLLSKDLLFSSKDFLGNIAGRLFNSTYNFIINIMMMIFILYFMLTKGRKMESTLAEYSPFQGQSLTLIREEVKKMVFGNAIGIPVVMTAQILVSALGYWIAGLDRVFFWAFLTGLFGLVPVVGTAAVWLPLSIFLLVTGNIWQGIVLILFSIVILSNTDNVCRLVLMKVMANIHPLIVIFGVVLGIPLFGFWGIIFGPLLISSFLLLVKIYYLEYKKGVDINKPD